MNRRPLSMLSFPNAIVHIDCDAFFTSVEESLRPELKGRPLITGAERKIVVCASYAAKARGVKRPMLLHEAKKICPELICLPSDYASYGLYSERMLEIMRRFTPEVEYFSIDEAYAGLSGLRRAFRMDYPEIARAMKAAIQKELAITVSAGLSATKTLAKIASERNKPDGFFVLRAKDLHEFLPGVMLEEVCGFGPNITAFLRKKGLRTAWDYIVQPPRTVRAWLGKTGLELWHELRGEGVYPVEQKTRSPYSLMKYKTFSPPSPDKNRVYAELTRNFELAFEKLRRAKLRAGFLAFCLRDQQFHTSGAEAALSFPVSSAAEAMDTIRPLFEKVFRPGTVYRMTGATLAKLTSGNAARQYSFFDDIPREKAAERLALAVDAVNSNFGRRTIGLATNLHIGARPPQRRFTLPLWKIKV